MKFFITSVTAGLWLFVAAAYAQAPRADAVLVLDSTQIALARYVVIKRIGVQDWRSAFRIRGHGDMAAARQALLTEADRLGADAVINVACFDQTDRFFKRAGFFCYGNAIRIRNERRVQGVS